MPDRTANDKSERPQSQKLLQVSCATFTVHKTGKTTVPRFTSFCPSRLVEVSGSLQPFLKQSHVFGPCWLSNFRHSCATCRSASLLSRHVLFYSTYSTFSCGLNSHMVLLAATQQHASWSLPRQKPSLTGEQHFPHHSHRLYISCTRALVLHEKTLSFKQKKATGTAGEYRIALWFVVGLWITLRNVKAGSNSGPRMQIWFAWDQVHVHLLDQIWGPKGKISCPYRRMHINHMSK